MHTPGKNSRVRLIIFGTNAAGKPHTRIRTITRDTTINTRELSHLFPVENLSRVLPPGTGVHINISHDNSITLQPHGHTKSRLNGASMLNTEKYTLEKDGNNILHIGDLLIRAQVIASHF